ncbi:nicotinamide-nucleotide amidohydrolase family protein, partial [Acinetobacter baumannii]
LVAQRLTDVPGSSAYFLEGVVAYSNEAKTRTLGVPPELIARHGAVSAPVAEAMAEGVRRLTDADFGLAVTGIAGPTGDTPEKPVGLVFIALA